MSIDNTLMELGFVGFVKQEYDFQLQELLKNDIKLKEVYIEIYPEDFLLSQGTFALLLRTSDKNVVISIDGNRLVIKKNDAYGTCTYIMNVPLSRITKCFAKVLDGYSEYILNVQNIYYKITILN